MGDITKAILAEIDERHRRYPGRPDRELLEHLLIALQRERVAAVGFDTTRLGERLVRSPLPGEARRLIARAIGQIWLDENMHARYALGVLLRQKDMPTLLEAVFEDIEGGMGGWMTAITQHLTWQDAPAERAAAALIELGGRLANRIPHEVRTSLTQGPLRGWCRFSADAEESAVLSFERMIVLAAEVAAMGEASELRLPEGFSAELARMAADERMHRRIFEAIEAALGDDDGFLPGHGVEDLESSLHVVEGWFTPGFGEGQTGATRAAQGHVLAQGGVVAVARGEAPGDKVATFEQALRDAGFFEVIERQTEGDRDALIAIKIDLMMAHHRDDPSSYTDPELVERLVDLLLERGYRQVAVCDSQNVYSRHYQNRTVEAVGRYVGLSPGRYRLVDLSLEQEPHTFSKGMGVHAIGRTWRDARARVSFAKLKTHPVATGQLTMRNAGVVIPQLGEFFFADRVSDFTTVEMALLNDFPPHFGLIDGYSYAADGLLGILADPTPKHPRIVVAGADVMCVDHVGFLLMGERDPTRTPDLRAAIEWFGDPRPRGRVLGDLAPIADWEAADAGMLAAPLAALAAPVYASFSLQGALFSAEMDPQAFPPISNSKPLATARALLRALLLRV